MSLPNSCCICKAVIAMFLCLLFHVEVFAQQDTIFVKQGDRLIGSFESMTNGVVSFSTAYSSGPLAIKWSDIIILRSARVFRLFDQADRRYIGRISIDTAHPKKLMVSTKDTVLLLDIPMAAELSIERKKHLSDFLQLETNIGYTLTKENLTHTGSLGVNGKYRTRKWNFSIAYEGFLSHVDSIDNRRGNLDGNAQYKLPNNWFLTGRGGVFYSSEQDVSNRITFLWGGGNYLFRRGTNSLYIDGGGNFNKEKYSTSRDKFVSLESFTGFRYAHNLKKGITAQAEFTIFPSLTHSGRVRTYSKEDLGYNISDHFNTGVQFMMNTDSKPPVASNKSDYIFSFRFGWHL